MLEGENRCQVFMLVSLLMVFGAANTIVLKLQNEQKIDGDRKFFHPYIQGCGMFLGEALCILVYLIRYRCKGKRQQYNALGMKPPVPILLIIIPAALDFLASNISYFALNMIPSSVWQLSKGGAIITTAIFTRILLKKMFTKQRLLGCAFATIGITIVGLSVVLYPSSKTHEEFTTQQEIIGISLVIGSLIFTGLQICYEELLFRKYTMDVFQLVGLEGLLGLILNIILVIVFSFIKCPWGSKCGGGDYIESFPMYFSQLAANGFLAAMCILEVFTIAISVSLAVTITKKISSMSRAIADVARVVLIWTFGFIVTKLTSYTLESDNLGRIIIEIVGFVLILIGTLIFHKRSTEIQGSEPLLLKSGIQEDIFASKASQISRQSLM